MTDPNTPTLDPADPVEGRLRRTFAVRAEDMALGDTTDEPPDIGATGARMPLRTRQINRPLVAAAIVIVLALAASGVVLVARGGDDEAEQLATTGEQPPTEEPPTEQPAAEEPPTEQPVDAVTAPRALVVALQDERILAATTLIGFDGVLALPVTDTVQARADTDAAVAAFETFVTESPDGAAYRSALDALATLDDLRSSIDADAGPHHLGDIELAQEVFERYSLTVGGLLDAQRAFVDTLDDPAVRAGGAAYWRGLILGEQTMQLGRVALLGAILPSAEFVDLLDQVHTEVRRGLDALLAETAGTPFAEAAAAAVGEIDEAGLLEASGASLDGGPTDIAALLNASEVAEDQAWPAFLDRVEEILAAGR